PRARFPRRGWAGRPRGAAARPFLPSVRPRGRSGTAAPAAVEVGGGAAVGRRSTRSRRRRRPPPRPRPRRGGVLPVSSALRLAAALRPTRASRCPQEMETNRLMRALSIASPLWRAGRRPRREGSEALTPRPVAHALDVVVHVELPRVWAEPELVDLVLALVREPRVDHVLREHPSGEQEVVVGLERGERLVE